MRLLIIICLSVFIFACSDAQKKSNANASSEQTSNQSNDSQEDDALFIEINEAIRADVNNASLYLDRSDLYLSINDYDAARADIDRAFLIDSNRIETRLGFAAYLIKQGKMADALNQLKVGIVLDPNNSNVYVLLSELYLIARNNEESLKYADLAVKYDMFNAKAYYFKGFNFIEMGDTVRAISSYQTAIEQDPDYFEAYLELGLIHASMKDVLAIDYYNNALKIQPENRDVLYSKGMFEQENGLYLSLIHI